MDMLPYAVIVIQQLAAIPSLCLNVAAALLGITQI